MLENGKVFVYNFLTRWLARFSCDCMIIMHNCMPIL